MSQRELPLVSIVIATYNYGHFIEETLRCLQAQTLMNWECLVVDDGSVDDTRSRVESLARQDHRIVYLHQSNAGQGAARNTALGRCRGAYIQFQDADDLLEPRKLELQVEFLKEHENVDIVYGGARYFVTEEPRVLSFSIDGSDRRWMPETSGAGREMLLELVSRNILTVNSALLRREVIEEVGTFDESLPPLEDWEFFIRCAAAGKRFRFADLPQTLALVRSHSASTSKNHARMRRAEVLMRKKVAASIADPQATALNRELMAYLEGLTGVDEVIGGAPLEGARRLLRASAGSRRLRWKAKWMFFALLSPVIPKRQFKRVTSFSLQRIIGFFRDRRRASALRS